ncbi:hypothetical protein Fmac_016197 [Flemingia macrophylla]|uniref:Uncharacterized protein n=1 Tax=Flemingia macrophylla TaxID=520843 RepID=A0ABD1MGV6_9FABA
MRQKDAEDNYTRKSIVTLNHTYILRLRLLKSYFSSYILLYGDGMTERQDHK